MRRLEGLDGLRGCLALYVMGSHIGPFAALPPGWGWLAGLVSHGQAAVDVFFILSGLVIVQSVQAFGGSPAAFLLARLGRIYPVFLVCFLIALAVAAVPADFQHMPWLGRMASDIWPHPAADAWWPRLATHLTLTHGLLPQAVLPDVWTSFLGSAWSLSTEFQFYLVIALLGCGGAGLSAAGLRWLALGLLTVAGLGVAWQAVVWPSAQFSRAFLPLAAQYFALGIASVGLVRGVAGARIFAGCVLAVCGLICFSGGADKVLPPLFWIVCLAAELSPNEMPTGGRAVRWGAAVLRPLRWLLRSRPVRWLGAVSYCLYLVHEPLQKLLGIAAAALADGDGAVFDAVFLPFAVLLPVAAAALLHHAIERPGIAWSRALAKRLAHRLVHPADAHAIDGVVRISGGV